MLSLIASLMLTLTLARLPLQERGLPLSRLSLEHKERVQIEALPITVVPEPRPVQAAPHEARPRAAEPEHGAGVRPAADADPRLGRVTPVHRNTLPQDTRRPPASAGAERLTSGDLTRMVPRQPAAPEQPPHVDRPQVAATLLVQLDAPPAVDQAPALYGESIDVHYPHEARRRGVQGMVILSFVVNPDGRAYQIQVQESLHPACDAAAIKAIRTARFAPGRQNGRPVSAAKRLGIRFKLTRG